MAMKYGGEYRPDRIRRRHLDRLGDDLGIAPKHVRGRADEMARLAVDLRGSARARLAQPWRQDPIVDAIDEIVAECAEVLLRAVAESA
jgi:hypothetical protein